MFRAALAGALAGAALWTAPAQANIVDITVSGTVVSGTDVSGTFGPPGGSLAGDPFSVVFQFNTDIGGQAYGYNINLNVDDIIGNEGGSGYSGNMVVSLDIENHSIIASSGMGSYSTSYFNWYFLYSQVAINAAGFGFGSYTVNYVGSDWIGEPYYAELVPSPSPFMYDSGNIDAYGVLAGFRNKSCDWRPGARDVGDGASRFRLHRRWLKAAAPRQADLCGFMHEHASHRGEGAGRHGREARRRLVEPGPHCPQTKLPPSRPGGRSVLGFSPPWRKPHSSFSPNRKMSALMDASAINASLTVNGPLTISSVIR